MDGRRLILESPTRDVAADGAGADPQPICMAPSTMGGVLRWLLAALLLVTAAGCTTLSDVSLEATLTPFPTPKPTAAPTLTPTITPTPTLTPTPAVVMLETPVARDSTLPEPTPAGALIAYSEHLDFYGEPDNYWAQRVSTLGAVLELELQKMAQRLQTDLPQDRIAVSIQDPSTSPRVRGMDCPARGLYYGETGHGALLTIFANETTDRVQVLAVAAHELAHHLVFTKFGAGGGDILLNEGLANWTSRDTWSRWQGWPSFDIAVRDYRRQHIYMPLEETLLFDPRASSQLGLGDCFALRDVRYNEWASFVEHLIDRYGLDVMTELWTAMPDNRRPIRPNRGSQPFPTVDYAAVLGKSLPELEVEWLEALYMIHAE